MIIDHMEYSAYQEKLADLVHKKNILKKQEGLSSNPQSYAEEWLRLAGDFALIEAIANREYCMDRYKRLSGKGTILEPGSLQAVIIPFDDQPSIPMPELPTEEFDWMNRADMGD